MAAELTETPYGPFVASHGATIRGRVLEQVDGGDEAGKDISDVRWIVRLRARAAGSATLLYDVTLTKSASNAATGYFDHYLPLGSTAYLSGLTWEEILVDTSNNDAATPTTFHERILRRWRQPVEAVAP